MPDGAGQAVAFVPVDEMRRGVGVDRTSVGLENRPAEGGDRAFAVGTGDVERRRQAQLRVTESVEQPQDTFQRQVVALRVQPEEPVDFGGGA